MVKADYGTIQEIKTPFQQSPSKSWVWAHNTDMVIVRRLHETKNFLCIHVYVYVVEARSCRQTRHSTHLQRINITHNTLYSFCFLSGHKTMKTVTENISHLPSLSFILSIGSSASMNFQTSTFFRCTFIRQDENKPHPNGHNWQFTIYFIT